MMASADCQGLTMLPSTWDSCYATGSDIWSEAKKGNLEASVVMRADRGSTVLSLIVSMRVFVLVSFIVSAELEGCQGWTFIHCSAKHMIQLPSNRQ